MRNPARHFYEFGDFRLDADKHRLLRDGEVVPLSPKAVEALFVLVRNPGKPLEREALMQEVCANSLIEDAKLPVAISHLRKALRPDNEAAVFLDTVARLSHRLLSQLLEVQQQP